MSFFQSPSFSEKMGPLDWSRCVTYMSQECVPGLSTHPSTHVTYVPQVPDHTRDENSPETYGRHPTTPEVPAVRHQRGPNLNL